MSRHNQILFLFLITLQSLCAQIPQGFDYQATVRDGVGNTITNTYVGFKFHILQGGAGVSSSYSEFHYLPTDDLGTVHLTIGTGDVETGTFDQIDWSLGNYHLSVEVNTGSGFVAMGTTQLMSVPFAMYALSSGDGSGGTNLPQGTNDGDLLQWDSTTNRWTVSSSSWHAFLPEVSTINATNTTALSSIVKGEIYSDGGATITSKGVVWSENPDPTVALATKTDEGGGAAPYTSSLTNLLSSKTYYYRAYATNSKGTGYGTTYVLYTMNGVASLSTGSVYNIGAFHATSEVSISEDGGAAITSKGLCWSTSPNPTLEDSFTEDGSGTGSYTSTMTGLSLDSTYYVRSYAINAVGTYYGNEVQYVNDIVYAPFEGIWSLAPIAGAIGVGPELGDLSWWSTSEEDVTTRACIFDDTFFFGNDGSFANNMGEATWLEGWQGVEEDGCGTPVYPQDGSDTSYTYSYDEGAQTITVYGVGAHIGVSKVYNNREFAAPAEINSVESITYEITEMSEDGNTMTLDISIGTGYWRFILVRQE